MQPKIFLMRNSIYLSANRCAGWSRASSAGCTGSKSGPISVLKVSRAVRRSSWGDTRGLVMSSEMSGLVFLKPSQRGKNFREFDYCQRFRCVQNKSLDASKTASFGPANIYDASVDAGAKWNGDPFQSGPVGADSWEIK